MRDLKAGLVQVNRWRAGRARVWTVWQGHVPIRTRATRERAARMLAWAPPQVTRVAVDARYAPPGVPSPEDVAHPPEWMMVARPVAAAAGTTGEGARRAR
jgi:hypothetical protein